MALAENPPWRRCSESFAAFVVASRRLSQEADEQEPQDQDIFDEEAGARKLHRQPIVSILDAKPPQATKSFCWSNLMHSVCFQAALQLRPAAPIFHKHAEEPMPLDAMEIEEDPELNFALVGFTELKTVSFENTH